MRTQCTGCQFPRNFPMDMLPFKLRLRLKPGSDTLKRTRLSCISGVGPADNRKLALGMP